MAALQPGKLRSGIDRACFPPEQRRRFCSAFRARKAYLPSAQSAVRLRGPAAYASRA